MQYASSPSPSNTAAGALASVHLLPRAQVLNDLGRTRLETIPSQTGERVSQFQMSLILGISPKQVAKLEKLPNAELPPAIRLACSYIKHAGILAAENLEDPTPSDIESVASSILLSREQTATLLGKQRQVLYSLCTGSHQKTVKRFYLLALLYLQQRYGLDLETRHQLDQQLAEGERFRDRGRRPVPPSGPRSTVPSIAKRASRPAA